MSNCEKHQGWPDMGICHHCEQDKRDDQVKQILKALQPFIEAARLCGDDNGKGLLGGGQDPWDPQEVASLQITAQEVRNLRDCLDYKLPASQRAQMHQSGGTSEPPQT